MLFADRQVVLASASPRRLEILERIGIKPELCPVEAEEYKELSQTGDADTLVTANAALKARAAALFYEDAVVLGADTVVIKGDALFGKPCDREEAGLMLRSLSGTTHLVYTGICLIDTKNGRSVSGVDVAEVTFHRFHEAEIEAYLDTGEPLDKAGAYGIQGKGALLVQKINGDYYTVMGLSLSLLRRLAQLLDFS
jgi:septum formation protein